MNHRTVTWWIAKDGSSAGAKRTTFSPDGTVVATEGSIPSGARRVSEDEVVEYLINQIRAQVVLLQTARREGRHAAEAAKSEYENQVREVMATGISEQTARSMVKKPMAMTPTGAADLGPQASVDALRNAFHLGVASVEKLTAELSRGRDRWVG